MNSCLYVGQVKHRRFSPKHHDFSYKLFYACIDLDEMDTVFDDHRLWSVDSTNIASFRTRDHLKAFSCERGYDDTVPLVERVRDYLELSTGERYRGQIRLLTHFSYFGFRFNPVSFYYCYDDDNENLKMIIAEVNNTPWGEQHCYLIPASDDIASDDIAPDDKSSSHIRYFTSKEFHVSPFMPMDIDYDWRFSAPGDQLFVHMENHRQGQKLFDATLKLEQQPLTARNLNTALLRFPFMTVKVVAAIYIQAFILLIKRIPIFDHPVDGRAENNYPDQDTAESVKTS
jgi:DUF1365 family protein